MMVVPRLSPMLLMQLHALYAEVCGGGGSLERETDLCTPGILVVIRYTFAGEI